jgi:hypothetical protein
VETWTRGFLVVSLLDAEAADKAEAVVDGVTRGGAEREASRRDGTELNQVDYQTVVHDR